MAASKGTLRYYGQASVMLDKPTKEKLKSAAAAAGMTLSEYIRLLANQATKDQQGILTSSMAPRDDKKELAGIIRTFNAFFVMMKDPRSLTEADLEVVRKSPLHFLLDEEIIKTGRDAKQAMADMFSRVNSINNKNGKEIEV